jgi:hypothetical protein
MIVIGSDPHKRSYTFSAVVAETGELRGSETVAVSCAAHARMLDWARALSTRSGSRRSRTPDTCQAIERFLLARGERVVRVTPKLMAGRRQAASYRCAPDSYYSGLVNSRHAALA